MSLRTRARVQGMVFPGELFDACARFLGADRQAYGSVTGPVEWLPWQQALRGVPGQGLPALLSVSWCPDGPLPTASGDTGVPDLPPGIVEVSFDTAYGYQGPAGGGCADLHAWLLGELAGWLSERGVGFVWCNEFTGEWSPGLEGVSEFGDVARGALA